MFIGDLFNKKTVTESLRPGERHHFETDPKTGKRVYKGIRGDQHDTPKRDTAGNAQERRDRDTDAMRKHDRKLTEFSQDGGSDPSDYFRTLASAWYNGVFDTGSVQKGIKSQQDVERLLRRGVVCPDGITRKFDIDYSSNFDGVVIVSDDYDEYGDVDDTDSRTGKPFGPYDYMEFNGDNLNETYGVAEARKGDTNFGSTVTQGSWVVYDGGKVKRFKSRDGAKAYAAKTGGKVASSEFYADNVQKQGVAEGLDDNGISFQVQKGKNKFATTLSVGGDPVGVYQYDANTGRSIAEIYPEFKGKGLGKLLVLHAIYTAANLGLDFQEDESRTSEYDNVLDSLSSNGYIVDDDGYWYVTGQGEQYLQQSLKQDVAEEETPNYPVYHAKDLPTPSLGTTVKSNLKQMAYNNPYFGVDGPIQDARREERRTAYIDADGVGYDRFGNPRYTKDNPSLSRNDKTIKAVKGALGIDEGLAEESPYMDNRPSSVTAKQADEFGGAAKRAFKPEYYEPDTEPAPKRRDWDYSDPDIQPIVKDYLNKNVMDKKPMTYKQDVPEGSVQDKLHRRHQELRKKRGAPDPDYYKELRATYDLPDQERYAKAAELKKKYKVTNEDRERYLDEIRRAGYDIVTERATLCPECGGVAFEDRMLAEKQDACYHKVKSRYKVWPSAYASGALVRCRKKGAANWGNKSKK